MLIISQGGGPDIDVGVPEYLMPGKIRSLGLANLQRIPAATTGQAAGEARACRLVARPEEVLREVERRRTGRGANRCCAPPVRGVRPVRAFAVLRAARRLPAWPARQSAGSIAPGRRAG